MTRETHPNAGWWMLAMFAMLMLFAGWAAYNSATRRADAAYARAQKAEDSAEFWKHGAMVALAYVRNDCAVTPELQKQIEKLLETRR